MSVPRTSAELTTRSVLEDALADAVSHARATGTAVALAFADVNDFRRVNDSLGTELGEELLTQVSARLRSAVRPGDLVAREGGEGFLVLVRDLPIDARHHAEAVGHRIADAMHAPFALGAAELLLDASVGISIFPDDAETPETLRKHADAAMYEARAVGGGVHIYGAGTRRPARAAGARGAAAAGDRARASSSCTTSRSCAWPTRA